MRRDGGPVLTSAGVRGEGHTQSAVSGAMPHPMSQTMGEAVGLIPPLGSQAGSCLCPARPSRDREGWVWVPGWSLLGWALSSPCPPVFHPPACPDLPHSGRLPSSASPAPPLPSACQPPTSPGPPTPPHSVEFRCGEGTTSLPFLCLPHPFPLVPWAPCLRFPFCLSSLSASPLSRSPWP